MLRGGHGRLCKVLEPGLTRVHLMQSSCRLDSFEKEATWPNVSASQGMSKLRVFTDVHRRPKNADSDSWLVLHACTAQAQGFWFIPCHTITIER